MRRIMEFIKREAVLCISAVCAVGTMFLVPPDGAYPGYIDLRVLCLLFCLMAVVAGFQACGIFRWLTYQLLCRCGSGRLLGLILILLPFFSSMLITNDVALLVFVPFTMPLLDRLNARKAIIPVLVLQTIAANLGSMATPVGNPQNLFLHAAYELTAAEFFSATLPLTGISLLFLSAAALFVLPKELTIPDMDRESLDQPIKIIVFGVLFLLCLLTVFHVLPYAVTTALAVIAIALTDPKILKKPDYALLVTFVCFFIISGNLGRIDEVRDLLQGLMGRSALLTSTAASQIISNVPAAVLLSGFTDQWRALLEGVNIGGLGTPIASLASLITLKLYLRRSDAQAGRYLLVFTGMNLAGLIILLTAVTLYR